MNRAEIVGALTDLGQRPADRGLSGVAQEAYGDRLDVAARFFVEEIFR